MASEPRYNRTMFSLRLSDDVDEYVRGVAERSGLSINKTCDILLRACRDQDFFKIELRSIPMKADT